MKVKVIWFATGNASVFEEDDRLLGPSTTIGELKGLVQIRFGFKAPLLVAMYNRNVLDNSVTLRSLGIVSSESTMSDVNGTAVRLQMHAFSESELDDDDKTSSADDEKIHEFTHEDFLKVCQMLGKSVEVSRDRLDAVKAEGAPRMRPRFLDERPHGSAEPPAAAAPAGPTGVASTASSGQQRGGGVVAPGSVPVERILRNLMHGLRTETAEQDYALTSYPGATEPMNFWDMRCAEPHVGQAMAQALEISAPNRNRDSLDFVSLELFFFGEFTQVNDAALREAVRRMLEAKGFTSQLFPAAAREAGCMYPLIAVPVSMTEQEARRLGEAVFEGFGRMKGIDDAHHGSGDDAGSVQRETGMGGASAAGQPPGCVLQ